jgi:hypothetical protein
LENEKKGGKGKQDNQQRHSKDIVGGAGTICADTNKIT